MKFAEHLSAHITPEWRKQYIQYEAFKEMLYAAQDQAPSIEVAVPLTVQCALDQAGEGEKTESLHSALGLIVLGASQMEAQCEARSLHFHGGGREHFLSSVASIETGDGSLLAGQLKKTLASTGQRFDRDEAKVFDLKDMLVISGLFIMQLQAFWHGKKAQASLSLFSLGTKQMHGSLGQCFSSKIELLSCRESEGKPLVGKLLACFSQKPVNRQLCEARLKIERYEVLLYRFWCNLTQLH
ncbi:hypothetical protein EYD10_12120 [Varanus komodoensis]|nr:hypothetical protein EYD10_12120 [Varanus komodoensis]